MSEETPAPEPKTKKMKTDAYEDERFLNFNQFSVERILCERAESKLMTLLGTFTGSKENAILVVEKQPITEESVEGLFLPDTIVTNCFHNDIYSQYIVDGGCGLGDVRVTGIYPATENHILKYSDQKLHIVQETPQLYGRITKPFIESQAFTLEWVHNILDGKAEYDRVIFSDPDPVTGFVLLPDLKWDRAVIQNLYVLALVRRRDIRSMRELNQDHLPLLKNILTKGKEAIIKEFGVPSDKLRVYVHYQPSYYHLHVHFTHLKYAAPKTQVGEAHLLEEVVDNIEHVASDYYQRKTISFCLKESSQLWREFDKECNQNKSN